MRWTSSSSESEDFPNSQAFMCAMTTIQHGQNKNPETEAAKQNSGVIYFSIYTCDFVTRCHSRKRCYIKHKASPNVILLVTVGSVLFTWHHGRWRPHTTGALWAADSSPAGWLGQPFSQCSPAGGGPTPGRKLLQMTGDTKEKRSWAPLFSQRHQSFWHSHTLTSLSANSQYCRFCSPSMVLTQA